MGVNDGSMTGKGLHVDLLRDSSTGPVILQDLNFTTGGAELISKPSSLMCNPVADVPGGTEIFGRAQCSGTLDAAYSMAAFGCGG